MQSANKHTLLRYSLSTEGLDYELEISVMHGNRERVFKLL